MRTVLLEWVQNKQQLILWLPYFLFLYDLFSGDYAD